MTQINLLPWREQARKNKLHYFYKILGATVVGAVVAIIILHLYYSGLYSTQSTRVRFLEMEIAKENAKVSVLNETMKKKDAIDTELNFIIALNKTNFDTVRILDELARVVPEAMELKKITVEDNKVIVLGKAGSDLQVTQLMKNIAKSRFFQNPSLTEISTRGTSLGDERFFQLTFQYLEQS